MNVRFFEYKPSSGLKNFVQSYWTGDFNIRSESAFSQSVVPNGFIELIIHLTDHHCALTKNNATWDRSPDYTLIGLYTKPYLVQFPALVRVFGIRFYPEGIANIFGVPPAHFSATFEDSTDVFGSRFREYCARLREAASLEAKITLTERFFLFCLAQNQKNFDYVRLAAEVIRREQGMLNQAGLMAHIPISTRQLQRAFKTQFGITAKEYMRISRLNAIQAYMKGREKVDFTDLTYTHGFADQAHFIREFKNFTGRAPRSFVKARESYIVNPDPATSESSPGDQD